MRFAEEHLQDDLAADTAVVGADSGEQGRAQCALRRRGHRVDTNLVLWFALGVTDILRAEHWPVMPVEKAGFHLLPVNFFDRNPALDVPSSQPKHCCH
ncbi:hypothetical protein [Streptomyces carpinensis]|uniref:Amine oxidase n=1 Tax=Streptomyces carpinensis TaxID=66369 RepID=A0ABV1VYC8_9ACTN|nr:hypothetical protein [Streptomyces carpinensis]